MNILRSLKKLFLLNNKIYNLDFIINIMKKIGLILMLTSIGLFFLNSNYNLTGNAISVLSFNINLLNFLSLMFFIIGITLFVLDKENRLERIVIPTGPDDLERAEKAARKYNERESDYIVISGSVPKRLLGSRSGEVYRRLRKSGIPSKKNILIESDSKNTKENVQNILDESIKNRTKSLGWVSRPAHLKRIKRYVGKYVQKHSEAKEIRMEYISTDRNWFENLEDKTYEVLRNALEKTRLLKYARKVMGRDK